MGELSLGMDNDPPARLCPTLASTGLQCLLYPSGHQSDRSFCVRICHSWALADYSVSGACGLSDDDDGKNDGLKWKLADSVR